MSEKRGRTNFAKTAVIPCRTLLQPTALTGCAKLMMINHRWPQHACQLWCMSVYQLCNVLSRSLTTEVNLPLCWSNRFFVQCCWSLAKRPQWAAAAWNSEISFEMRTYQFQISYRLSKHLICILIFWTVIDTLDILWIFASQCYTLVCISCNRWQFLLCLCRQLATEGIPFLSCPSVHVYTWSYCKSWWTNCLWEFLQIFNFQQFSTVSWGQRWTD